MRFGSAIEDITPSADVPLLGYDFRQEFLPAGNSGVRDSLAVRVIALDGEDGAGPALIITLDLCIISVRFARLIREAVASACKIDVQRILVACSHTHSGPWLDEKGIAEDVAAVLPNVQGDAAHSARQIYSAKLPEIIVQAAAKACGLFTTVDIYRREMPLGLGYNRRVPDGQGAVKQCWNPLEYPELQPLAQADPMLSVLTLVQRGSSRRHALWCHGTHPVVLGKTSTVVSADWPGAANAYLSERGISGHFLLGACGDVQPWLSTQESSLAVDQVGHAAGAMVALASESGGEVEAAPSLQVVSETHSIGGREVDLMAWNIGGQVLLTSPTELFAPLAAELRQRVGGAVMIVTNANGWTGYWPHSAAFAEGGYEINAAKAMGRSAGDSEHLIDCLANLAKRVAGPASA